MKRLLQSLILSTTLAFAVPAAAAPVTDCPLRDAPFSIDTPLIDILLSPAARAVLNKAAPGRFTEEPRGFIGTKPPTFAAIVTLRDASRFTGLEAKALGAMDPQLRALPVTQADKAARCARYDNDRPDLAVTKGRPNLLLFEKINGFRDDPSINGAHAAIVAMAERKGWSVAVTDKGGSINPADLRKFDAVIWNNISGDVLTLAQRRALKRYMEQGGGFVAIHGSGGDPAYFWNWYVDKLIGARFKGHTLDPQFRDARIMVENASHPVARALPREWVMNDEWYSFQTSPRAAGANVILRLDEASYKPGTSMGADLRMGADHPIAWTNCIGKGRSFYSAIGHRPETYVHSQNVALLEAAIEWAATDRLACPARTR